MIMHDVNHIQEKIDRIKDELYRIGPMRPGSISKQYNICGNPNCRCKDPVKPKKHGPYYQLSYTWRGKSTTRFVRRPRVEAMRAKRVAYKRLRELVTQWVDAAIALEQLERNAAARGT